MFLHPTGPCVDCGKPISNSHWYYAGGHDGKKLGYYHSTCGDPFGIKAAVAAERERCAKIAEVFGNVKFSDADQATAHGIAQAIRDGAHG